MCISIFPASTHTRCIPGACRDQKTAWDLLVLDLWMAVSPQVGAEVRIQVLCKDKCF